MLLMGTQAQTDEEKAAYPEYTEAFARWGVTWESVKIKTDNGYTLTAFHWTGMEETGPFEITRPVVVMQHGMGGQALSYLGPTSAWKDGFIGVVDPKEPPVLLGLA